MAKPASSRRPQISVKDLAYMAGFFDGEGCVMFPQDSRRAPGMGGIRTIIGNTDRKILEQYAAAFGGTIRTGTHHRSHWRTYFYWQVNGENARRCLRLLLPYLREKRPQAELALHISTLPPAERVEGMAQLKALKRIDQGTTS